MFANGNRKEKPMEAIIKNKPQSEAEAHKVFLQDLRMEQDEGPR